ncbi:MAG: 16S rRNA (cytidine(1402)-2'-O)-methyltransferase [Erythrobacter sp.]|nr:16S rRNA (cytidine(1402)-2'-O)-methyltransferase [Erythrobacter sp.]
MVNTIQPESSLSGSLAPGLYIVATPIGNLGDITLRALDVLRRCDRVACEDTRVTGKLLKHLGVSQRLVRHDDHASAQDRARLVEAMRGKAVALVSDAGTPLVSDPGYRLVNEARDAGVAITVLPGPCAAVAGLTLSGLPCDRFLFAGFLPVKDKARQDFLAGLGMIDATLVLYESAQRLVRSLEAIAALWPRREVAVARELTKLHEECRRASAAELAAHYSLHAPKGEVVLLIGPPDEQAPGDPETLLREALKSLKPSQAAAQVARATGHDRKALYDRAMELKAQ